MSRNVPGRLTPRALSLLIGEPERRPSTSVVTPCDRRSELLTLLDRARHDLQRGWNAAALDALKRAVAKLEESQA